MSSVSVLHYCFRLIKANYLRLVRHSCWRRMRTLNCFAALFPSCLRLVVLVIDSAINLSGTLGSVSCKLPIGHGSRLISFRLSPAQLLTAQCVCVCSIDSCCTLQFCLFHFSFNSRFLSIVFWLGSLHFVSLCL